MRRKALLLLAATLTSPLANGQTVPYQPGQATPARPGTQAPARVDPHVPGSPLPPYWPSSASYPTLGGNPPPAQLDEASPPVNSQDASVPGSLPAHSPASPPVHEDLLSFDPGQVQLHWMNGRWLLQSGGVTLKEFRLEHEAQEARRLIHELHLNQMGRIGAPAPVLEYWLSDGQAPHMENLGRQMLPLDPGSLRIEQVQGQWYLRNGTRSFFCFGTHAEQAQQALDVIRHHGFSQISFLGQNTPSMLLFLSNQAAAPVGRMPAPPSLATRMHTPGIHAATEAQPPAITPAGAQAPAPEQPTAPADPVTIYHNALLQESAQQSAAPTAPATPSKGLAMPGELVSAPRLHASNVALSDLNASTDRLPFDWRQVQVRLDGHDWKLFSGGMQIGNFGGNEQDARLALAAMQHYHFTEHDVIGYPAPAFSYYLSSGQAPRGIMAGVEATPFKPDSLDVRQVNGSWAICQGKEILFDFGKQGEKAWAAKGIIDRYKFDHICRIGHGTQPAMTFLVRAR